MTREGKTPLDTIEQIKELSQKGFNVAEISRYTGVPRSVIRKVCGNYGNIEMCEKMSARQRQRLLDNWY